MREVVKEALSVCGYPEWSFKLVEQQMKAQNIKKKESRHTESGGNRDVQVVIPYVKGLSEACARIYRKYGAKTAMRPFQTIRNYVVHPKDKLEKEEISECVYCIPCKGCEKVYVGETGRNFGVRMSEHRKEVERNEDTRYTRSQKQTAEITMNKQPLQITPVGKITSSAGRTPGYSLLKATVMHDGYEKQSPSEELETWP